MNRVPSIRQLDVMSAVDRDLILESWVNELREERQAILSGDIQPWNGATRRSILDSNRRRLKRIYTLGDRFDVKLSQPEQSLET
jgi:hypothetical protein